MRLTGGRYGDLFPIRGSPYFLLQLVAGLLRTGLDYLYSCIIRNSIGSCGKHSRFQYGIRIVYPADVHVGKEVKIGRNVSLTKHNINSKIEIGDQTYIDQRVHIDYSGGIVIAKGVTISEEVKIFTHSHGNDARSIPTFSALTIGAGAWIGFGAVILPGVSFIGCEAVVGACSLVTKNVDNHSIVAGNPAKEIGTSDLNLKRSGSSTR